MTTYFADNGHVCMSDGPWSVRLTPEQADQLLSIFDGADAVTHFNSLYGAMTEAGLDPCSFARRPALRLVSDRGAVGIVRDMLAASVAAIAAEPPSAA